MTTGLPPHELLQWDTEFWGKRIGRASHQDGLSEWACENTVGMVGLLLDASDVGGIHRAEENGYRTMDIRVTLARPTDREPVLAFPFRPEDISRLVEIARESHRITRFYADPLLPDEKCDDLYESWIRQSCDGWASAVLVAVDDSVPVGYVTVHQDTGLGASIGLIAVHEDARSRGVGQALVRSAIGWAHQRGSREMTVVTQGRNIAAQRVFQACGFRTTKTEVWLHAHYGVQVEGLADDGTPL